MSISRQTVLSGITLLIFGSLLIFFTPLQEANAVSGCCSHHGGVDCSAGPQANGKVICYDGWRGSSCYYSEMVKCQGYSFTSTPEPSPTQTEEPEETVLGTETASPTLSPEQLTDGDNTATWIMLGTPVAFIGWILYRYRNVIGKKKGGDNK